MGIVKDSKNTDVKHAARAFVFLPYSQSPHAGNATFYVRTNQDPVALTATVRNVIAGFDNNLPVYSVKTLTAQVDEIMFTDRLVTVFLAGPRPASVAACGSGFVRRDGLRGGAAHARNRNPHGAWSHAEKCGLDDFARNHRDVWAPDLLIGLIAAYGLGKLIESLLFGVKASDPPYF